MSVLVDTQINDRLAADPPLATNVVAGDFLSAKSKVQAASLDLTVGGIFIPGAEPDKPGGAYTPLDEHVLLQGHTAVVRTKEVLNLGPDLAGIAFPPASVSLKGLLMTNPGHVDPEYRGPLHLTVINMSQVPFSLKVGDRIVRVLFMTLGSNPQATYASRHQKNATPNLISPELMGRLSADFMNIEGRAREIADGAVTKAQSRAAIISFAIPIAVALIAYFGQVYTLGSSLKTDIQKLSERVTVVETKFGQQALNDRIQKLEDVVSKLNPSTPTK